VQEGIDVCPLGIQPVDVAPEEVSINLYETSAASAERLHEAQDLIRIAVVGGTHLFRSGLRLLLQGHPGIAPVAGGAGLTRDAVDTYDLDLILLDVDDSSEDPLRVLTHARSRAGDARIVALVGHHARADPAAMVLAGAHGIVEKDVSTEQLTVAIRKVHAGELWIDRATTSQLISGLTGERQLESANGERTRITSLSAREREVVALITAGLTNKAIGRKLGISDNTVRHHLTSIFAKLETPDRVGLVIYAFRNGLAEVVPE
jgi:DNA-binding NarL/FixJ family response regulator